MPVQLSTPKPALSSASHEQSVATLIPRDGGTLADLNGFGIHWKIDGLETLGVERIDQAVRLLREL